MQPCLQLGRRTGGRLDEIRRGAIPEYAAAIEKRAEALHELYPDVTTYLAARLAFEEAMLGRSSSHVTSTDGENRSDRARLFEVATMGSTFWVTMGLLGGWQIRRTA
jgi:hypothetical protein